MKSRIMYIENKAEGLTGSARIGRVTFSKTGRTLYYGGKSFQSLKGSGFKSNYHDVESGEEYWISGCKKDGSDRLYGERVPIEIDDDVREEYWSDIRLIPNRSEQKRVQCRSRNKYEMNVDLWIDKLVQHVNSAPREANWKDVTPPSVRVGAFDEVDEMWDWNIKSSNAIHWVEDLEAKLPHRFPKSFRSLITRYIFPQFDIGTVGILANTPEGIDPLYELRTGIFEDEHLSAILLKHGFIPFARPAGGGYDPICFDTAGKTSGSEYPMVNIDHEGILCHDKIKVTKVLAPSFHELIKQHLEG